MIQTVGLFDSGVGGLSVLQELRVALPQLNYIYLGDTARTPYGAKSAETIRRYSEECAGFLLGHKIDLLVVACNTASSLALERLTEICPCPVIGTLEPAVRACLETLGQGPVGVIGTEATISSGVYARMLQHHRPGVKIISKACPLFVPLVEQGMIDGSIVEQVVELYLEEMHAQQIESLVLGCTHYPMLRQTLAKFLGPQVQIIECSRAIAQDVALMVATSNVEAKTATHVGELHCFVTDEPTRFARFSEIALKQTLSSIERCVVERGN